MAHCSERMRDQSPSGNRPNMSDLRIVLLGKNASENNIVGNIILDKYEFGKKSSYDVEEHSEIVEERNITVISTTHLLKSSLSLSQIAEQVSAVCPPEPHVIILVLKHNDFSERKRDRVPSVLHCFGEQAMKRTMILTTDDKKHSGKQKSENEHIQQITEECGGGRLQLQNTQRSQILQKVDEIITREFKTKQGSSVDQEDTRSEDRRQKEREEENGSRKFDVSNTISTSEMKKLTLVLCGYDAGLKNSMSKLLLGRNTPISTQSRSVHVWSEVEIHGRLISLVELLAVNHLSEQEVMCQTLRCVSLCDPGVHVFLLIVPANPLTDEERSKIEKVQMVCDSREHFIVLFTSYSTKERAEDFIKRNTESQSLISLCGGQYRVMGLKEPENSRQIPDLLDYIENMKTEPYSLQMYVKAQENRVRRETEEKYEEQLKRMEDEMKEKEQTIQLEACDLRVVLLGKNVSENSRVEYLILGTDAFDSEAPLVERKLQSCSQRVGGRLKDRRVMVINSPQLLHTHISDDQITQTVRECVSLSDPGLHAFILVLQYKDFTEEDMRRVKHVLEKFSEEAIKRTIVLTTDEESLISWSSYFEDKSIHELIKECGGRHLQLDERNPEWRSEIFNRVDKILEENQEDYLTCEMFHDVKESLADEEQSRSEDSVRSEEENEEHYQEDDGKLKERSDEVSENVSGKQKLNLVLCGSDGSLTVSVSKLLQGKKLNLSHQKANSEECVKREEEIHGRVISLVELPAVNQLSEQEVMRQTLRCVSLCDPGVHVFLIIVPVGPLTDEDKAEIVKIQSIFDSRDHFMVLFISDISVEEPVTEFVKHSPESQSLISRCGGQYRVMGLKESENSRQIPELLDYIENMKTKPYSLQMYVKAQENRVRGETEEKYKAELKTLENKNKELQARIQSDGAESKSDDQKCLRIVLIGRTGSGKSATGNTILGREEFQSKLRSDSVTTVCEKGVGEVDGRSVAVVDTPGLFDTTLSNDQVVEEIVKCVSLSSPGPHVFVIVLSLGRFTREETDTVDLIKKIFGHKSVQFSIVLFTRGDDLGNESIEDYVREIKSGELKKLIRDCGNRFLAFNNKEKQDKTQVIQLLNMIEEVKNTNEGRYFTNSMFEEAEMSIKKRMEEILKEKEREIQKQREELQGKYEMEMENVNKRLEEEKQRADEERKKMENQIRKKEENLRKEFEEKEKIEQEKRETENQKRSEEEKQQRAEYHQKIEEMKREIVNQRLEYEKQQKEREEEDRKKEEKYREDQEKMKNEQERIIAELQMKQEEETKKRDLEEKKRRKEEEEERQRWERKIKEAENDRKETQEGIKRQQREWEDEKKQRMREREEEERKRKEKQEEQLREKQEELEKMRKRFEREREEERKKIEKEIQKQRREREEKEREYEEKKTEMERHYERLERERKEEWERRKRADDESLEEERKRWKKMIEHLTQEQEEKIKRRETEEKKRKEKEDKERDEMKQKYEEEIKVIKKNHEDEARRKAEEMNDFRERKEQHVQELKLMLEERQKQHELLEKLYKHLQLQKGEEIIELKNQNEEIKKQQDQKEKEIIELKNQKEEIKKHQDQKEKETKELQDQKEKERKKQQAQKEKERKELLEEIEKLKKSDCVIL